MQTKAVSSSDTNETDRNIKRVRNSGTWGMSNVHLDPSTPGLGFGSIHVDLLSFFWSALQFAAICIYIRRGCLETGSLHMTKGTRGKTRRQL
ncbi:hypothetical protein VNO80_15474 [Phaseolus coccineus]|uniref:Uncharacterized protein n=1 Tax=Phaseolus coccineus TaxID=3886 RepID=A0AAN9R1V2_PHACN